MAAPDRTWASTAIRRSTCLLAAAALWGCEARHSEVVDLSWSAPPQAMLESIEVPPPPFSEDVFPCSDCHDPDFPVNPNPRPMRMAHEEIVLHHDEQNRWCLDCHSAEDRDQLHLAGGKLVPFEESYRLCGQCHGDKYRDWRAGVHGRRSGNWDGEKTYLLCVHCHDAHDPKFTPLEPMAPPRRPARRP